MASSVVVADDTCNKKRVIDTGVRKNFKHDYDITHTSYEVNKKKSCLLLL